MKDSVLEVTLDDELASQMEEICEELGVTVEYVLGVFAHEFVARGGFPFEVTEKDLEGLV